MRGAYSAFEWDMAESTNLGEIEFEWAFSGIAVEDVHDLGLENALPQKIFVLEYTNSHAEGHTSFDQFHDFQLILALLTLIRHFSRINI